MSKEVEETKKLKKQLAANILALLVRIIGESVKDKLARAVFIGIVGMAGYYFDLPEVETSKTATPTEVIAQQ